MERQPARPEIRRLGASATRSGLGGAGDGTGVLLTGASLRLAYIVPSPIQTWVHTHRSLHASTLIGLEARRLIQWTGNNVFGTIAAFSTAMDASGRHRGDVGF
jgi:hypothetical protein